MPVITVASSADELKKLSKEELTSLWFANHGSLHVLHFMDKHNITAKEMIKQVEASNDAVRPLLKRLGIDLTFELDLTTPDNSA